MDVAFCTEDGSQYSVNQFAALAPDVIQRKRRFLMCLGTGCQAQAYYRKASRSGQAACFGAYHTEGCEFAAFPNADIGLHGGEDEDVLVNDGSLIVLDLNYGAAPEARGPVEPGMPNPRVGGGRHLGPGRREAVAHRRLSTILRNLITTESFRNSTQQIRFEDRDVGPVNQFFKNFLNVEPVDQNRYKGYWGFISHARYDEGMALWLNTGSRGELSCVIRREIVPEFLGRFGLSEPEEELAGAHILLLGTLQVSGWGKPYIALDDISGITVKLAP